MESGGQLDVTDREHPDEQGARGVMVSGKAIERESRSELKQMVMSIFFYNSDSKGLRISGEQK